MTAEKKEFTVWYDPREITINSNPRQQDNPGFQPHNMAKLREDIRKKGLKQPLEIFLINEQPVLIAGERRLRSVLELLAQEAQCLDRSDYKFKSAEDVYGEVPCTITQIKDEKDRAHAAVMENLLHEHLTDYELVLQCDILEASGHTRAEQAQVFDKSEAWVSQSHSLLKAHPKILEAMRDGTLGRTQALQFLAYPIEKVEAILDKAISYNKKVMDEKEQELETLYREVTEAADAFDEAIEAAKEKGDEDEVTALRRKRAEKEQEAEEIAKKKEKTKKTGVKRKPKPSISEINQAAQDEDVDGNNRHIPVKLVRRITDQMTALLGSGEELINPNDNSPYSRREVRILVDAFNWFLARNHLKSPLEALHHDDDDDEAIAAK